MNNTYGYYLRITLFKSVMFAIDDKIIKILKYKHFKDLSLIII